MMTFHYRSIIRVLVPSMAVLLFLAGCASKPVADPVDAMMERDLSVRERLTIMDQASREVTDEKEWRENLKAILSRPGYPVEARIQAFEHLYRLDANDARTTLFYRFPTLPSFEFVAYACERIAAENWQEFTPALIRSLSQPAGDRTLEERPDYQALATLHPGVDMETVIFDYVSTPVTDPVLSRWQLTAFELLNEIDPDGDWRHSLETLSATATPFMRNVQAAQAELAVTPRTREELRWLTHLRQPDMAATWADYASIASALPPVKKQGLRLRHLPILASARDVRPDLLNMSRDTLYSMLEVALDSAETFPRAGRGSRESLSDWKDHLVWADLVALHLARDLVHSPSARKDLFNECDADRRDPTTEFGGLIHTTGDRWVIAPFFPTRRHHDQKFYAPNEMITAGYTAPFHYHFHVQKVRNRKYAGPGVGDLQYADAMAVNALVFTSISQGRLNVDYYTENKMVVDLGILE